MEEGQCPPQVLCGLLVPALPQPDGSESVKFNGLADGVTDLQVDSERLSVAPSRLPVPAPARVHQTKLAKRAGLAGPVTVLTRERQCLPKVAGGLTQTALCRVGGAQHLQCRRFGRPVAGLRCRAAGMTVHGGGIGEVADIQVAEDGGAQADGVAGPSVVSGVCGDRDKVRPLSVQPGQRRRRAGDRRNGPPDWGSAGW